MKEPDEIRIRGLKVLSRVGVPDEERKKAQQLVINLTLWTERGFEDLGDRVGRTVDYETVANEVRALCAEGARKLIETLAQELARALLEAHPLARVEVEVCKFILPDCDSVSVRVVRTS